MGKLTNKLSKIYINKEPLTDKDMEMSRNVSILEGSTARTVFTLTSGAFLVGYAKFLGASDQIAGIIAAIPVLAGIIMVFSPLMFERMENRKLITCLVCFIGRLMLGSMIVIPFIKTSIQNRIIILVVVFLVANLFISFALPSALAWILSVTPDNIRGRYFGKRESIVLGVVTLMTLIMGQILDKYKKLDQQFTGFIILYLFVIIVAIINTLVFSRMKEPKVAITDVQLTLKDVLTLPIKNKKFMKVVLILTIWNFGFQLGSPFTAVYMVSRLKLSYGMITSMVVLASIVSVISVRYWGKVADKKSWLFLLKLMVVLQILSFFIWSFINKYTVVSLLPVTHILSGAAIAGVNISITNLQYNYSPLGNKTVYIGFSSAVSGIFGFSGTIVGSFMLKLTEQYKIVLFGLNIGNMQMLFLVSSIILVACIFCLRDKSLNKEMEN
jgi:MFS family permease